MSANESFSQHDLVVEGLHCADCVVRLEGAISSLGAKPISVDVASGHTVVLLPASSSLPQIMSSLAARGYSVKAAAKSYPRFSQLDIALVLTGLLTVPLLLSMFVPGVNLVNHRYVPLMASACAAFGVYHFGKGAWGGLKRSELSMDALLFLGIVGALMHGFYSAEHASYETSASITFFALIGAFMERRAVRSTTAAIDSLMRAAPRMARRLRKPFSLGQFDTITVSQLETSDRAMVANGEAVPADGVILEGNAAVDESFLSGEALPRAVSKGDQLFAGSLIVDGSIILEVRAKENQTLINQIISSLAAARQHKPPIQRIGDQVSRYFVPIIILIAILTLAFSFYFVGVDFDTSIMRALAVLVVACPCAMGLATPTAIVTVLGRLARSQIIVRSGAALEILARARRAIFDKTGTLTTGRFNLRSFEVEAANRQLATSAILGLELNSTHPIARSLSAALEQVPALEFKQVDLLANGGIHGYDISSRHFALRPDSAGSSQLVLKLELDDLVIARITMDDQLQPNAQATIARLHSSGITTEILSGDSTLRCQIVAEQLKITKFRGGMTPQEKLASIRSATASEPTVFIGDGINDSPALAAASVGVSPGSATDLARYSADIVLLDGLSSLPEVVLLARKTLSIIKQNLFWALGYNLVTVPLAISGAISPIAAAVIMAFSDVVVVGNSLRLRFCKVEE